MFIYPDAQYIWHIYLPNWVVFEVNVGNIPVPYWVCQGYAQHLSNVRQRIWHDRLSERIPKNDCQHPRGVPSLNPKGMVNWHPLNGTIWHPNWKVQVGDISSLNRSNWGVPWCTAQVAFLLKLLAHPCLPRCRACWEHLGSFLWRAGEFILKNPGMS